MPKSRRPGWKPTITPDQEHNRKIAWEGVEAAEMNHVWFNGYQAGRDGKDLIAYLTSLGKPKLAERIAGWMVGREQFEAKEAERTTVLEEERREDEYGDDEDDD